MAGRPTSLHAGDGVPLVMRVLVTGANGFVGRSVCTHLRERGFSVRIAVRNSSASPELAGLEVAQVGDIGPNTDWADALEGMDCVVHLAARAHRPEGKTTSEVDEFFRVNGEGTRRLAESCVGRIQRLVYLSSIGVNGSLSGDGAFDESSPVAPVTAYARSKLRGEESLLRLATLGELDSVVLRPPLVYGAGAPGNLERLARLIRSGLPLPLGAVRNRRSLVGVDHLVEAIYRVLVAPCHHQHAYCVADREVVSTPDIIRALCTGLGRPARLLPVPSGALSFAGSLLGQGQTVAQLIGSLAVNGDAFRAEFGDAQPGRTTAEGLSESV